MCFISPGTNGTSIRKGRESARNSAEASSDGLRGSCGWDLLPALAEILSFGQRLSHPRTDQRGGSGDSADADGGPDRRQLHRDGECFGREEGRKLPRDQFRMNLVRRGSGGVDTYSQRGTIRHKPEARAKDRVARCKYFPRSRFGLVSIASLALRACVILARGEYTVQR